MLESESIIIPIQLDAQQHATSGFGYLFDHDDIAAELARKVGADYILVGRLHKPSIQNVERHFYELTTTVLLLVQNSNYTQHIVTLDLISTV